jgi:hypothetical protein
MEHLMFGLIGYIPVFIVWVPMIIFLGYNTWFSPGCMSNLPYFFIAAGYFIIGFVLNILFLLGYLFFSGKSRPSTKLWITKLSRGGVALSKLTLILQIVILIWIICIQIKRGQSSGLPS